MNSDESFFHHLYAADVEDEGDDDPTFDVVDEFWSKCKPAKIAEKVKVRKRRSPLSHQLGNSRDPPAASDEGTGSLRRVLSHPEMEIMNRSKPPALKTSSSAPPRSKDIMPRGTRKRQKITKSKLVPEELQFFKGKLFYFFPNDKINAARRMRIEKFEQYGGTWVQHWGTAVQVVIMENQLKHEDLLKYLKITQIPVSRVQTVV
jgi:hypothetical protein